MNIRKVLVTGASGFIGGSIVRHLAKRGDYEVCGIYHTRKPADLHNVHFKQSNFLHDDSVHVLDGMDVVIHTAAVSSGSKNITSMPFMHVTPNGIMNMRIVEAVYKYKIPKLIFLSSGVVYPMNAGYPMREEEAGNRKLIYPVYSAIAGVKLFTEELCEFVSRYGTQCTVLRPSNIYGPHDKFDLHHSHVLSANIAKVVAAQDGDVIEVWGTGEVERDLLFVDDLTQCVTLVIDQQDVPFDVLNASSGTSISVREMVKTIIRLSGKNLTMIFNKSKPDIPTKLAMDNSKAYRRLGWRPVIGLEDGIRRTMDWYSATQDIRR